MSAIGIVTGIVTEVVEVVRNYGSDFKTNGAVGIAIV